MSTTKATLQTVVAECALSGQLEPLATSSFQDMRWWEAADFAPLVEVGLGVCVDPKTLNDQSMVNERALHEPSRP